MDTNNKCCAGRHTQKKWHLNECYQISMLHDMHILMVKNSKNQYSTGISESLL